MKLKQTKQCKTYPWKLSTTVADIPNYCLETHKALRDTIADATGNVRDIQCKNITVMTCHKSIRSLRARSASSCVGWLHNQLGKGSNVPLRIHMMYYSNAKEIEIDGEQKNNFDETFS